MRNRPYPRRSKAAHSEGEAAIVASGGANGFTVVARVRKTGWEALAK